MNGRPSNLTEIEVESDHDATVLGSSLEYLAVRQIAVSGIPHMNCVMTLRSQPLGDCRRQIHVEEEAHPGASSRNYFLARQPCRI